MTTLRGSLACTAGPGGVYALGGFDGNDVINSAELYEIRMGLWRTLPAMRTCHAYAAAVRLHHRPACALLNL